jgi:phytoene dehydrogenase-like protein
MGEVQQAPALRPHVRLYTAYVYLYEGSIAMKTKLTLSIDKARVAALRKASARRSKTISALVEELADELEKKDSHEGLEWLNDWSKALNGKYTDQDLDEDPRFAYAMGHKGARKK